MDYLVGIDLGSTTLKAVIYDTRGNVIASGCRPTERFHPDPAHPEWTVWQPEQIWGGSAAALKEAIAAIDDPRNIKAVAVTGMGMDGLPIDEKGNWLYPLISWHCPRTQPQFEWWIQHIGAEKTFAIGGNTLWRFSTALRLLWMAEHEPEILRRTHKWLLIEDFVNFMLCGVAATDYTMASCTLLFDQRKLSWSDEMLALSGIDRRLLCDAFPSGTVLGEVTPAAAAATGLGGRHAGGAGRTRLPVRRAAGRRHQTGRHPGRERHLGDRAGLHPNAGADPRSAADRRDGRGTRGARPLRHLGRRGLVRHAGVVSQGVRLRGEASRPRQCSGVDWDFLMAEAAQVAGRRARRHVPAAHVGRRMPGGRQPVAGGLRRPEQLRHQRRHAAGDHRGAGLPVPGHRQDHAE